jgi:hypothetical protein
MKMPNQAISSETLLMLRPISELQKKQITVEFQKRAHNPLLIAAGLNKVDTQIPWLENKKLRIVLD